MALEWVERKALQMVVPRALTLEGELADWSVCVKVVSSAVDLVVTMADLWAYG